MKRTDNIILLIFASIVVIIVAWIRYDLQYFKPILETSLLPFQLILGVSIIAIFRNIIGIKTFGVFGPTIIALGLMSTGLLWGLALYLDLFIFAVAVTFILMPLAMEESHRVAIIITVTAILITLLDLIGEIYRMPILESTMFFPVLITSWLANRFVIQVEESDWNDSSKQLLGTIVVIIIAYFVISINPLVIFLALNPETWAVIILLNVVIALRVNFRLSEYIRFDPIIKKNLSHADILGMNRRNQVYVFNHNPRNIFPYIAKDKMKLSLHQLGIPTPETYAVIQNKKELKIAEKIMKEKQTFVIKPANGSGGSGILVITKKEENVYVAKGKEYSIENLKAHINLILGGQYSSEWGDVAILEEKVETDPIIKRFYWGGVPDIRIIVFEGFPVMSMTRLPTKESQGLANLHKGAIGMGISISDGVGITPYWRGRGGVIEKHPDTGAVLKDMKIDDWSRYLEIACLAQAASKLGYAGVDIVPTNKGPMVLEVNKRPGLEIQNTNIAGLLKRLEFVEKRLPLVKFKSVSERVKLCQEWDRMGWNE